MIYLAKLKWTILLAFCLPVMGLSCNTVPKTNTDIDNPEQEESYHEKEVNISEIVLGPGDEIEVSVWRNPDLDGKFKIDPLGTINLHLIGIVEAGGLNTEELREKLYAGYSRYLVNPQVKVLVTAHRSRKVYVLGEVNRPGIYHIGGTISNLAEAVAKSGGFTPDANQERVLLIRGGVENATVKDYDMAALLLQGNVGQNPFLSGGDIVYVPSSTIAKVDRFFKHLALIIYPLVEIERGIIMWPSVKDVLRGDRPQGLQRDVRVTIVP